eukprot:c16337_g1_i1 orf=436-924(+)
MKMMGRVLLQEAAHHQTADPCRHSSLNNVSAAVVQNASMACHHAYGYVRHHEGSPIPYLLAGLAAMLALIAISLFILACSYWKLVGCVEQHAARAYSASTSATSPHPHSVNNMTNITVDPRLLAPQDHSSKLVVIMAGHDKPTCLAQPVGIVETLAASSLKV